MSHDAAPAVAVESSPAFAPSAPVVPPPVVVSPEVTPEQAETVLTEAMRQRVVACQREMNEALARHKCAVRAVVEAYIGPDGITRHGANVEVFPV
jgi:hypothetical protein